MNDDRNDRRIESMQKQIAQLRVDAAANREAIRGDMRVLNVKVAGIVLAGTVVGNFAATWLIRAIT